MKKKIDFNVSIDYQFFSGAPESERLATQLKNVVAQVIADNKLNVAKEYNGESVVSVAPLGDIYTAQEVDAVLCVFDEFTNLANSILAAEATQYLKAIVAELKEVHENGGTPALRVLAMSIGKIIENVWQELTLFGFNDRWDGAWDLEFIPELLLTVHANHGEFPPAENTGAWINAALEVLEVEQDEYNLKKLVHNHPEFAANLRVAAKYFKAALDMAGADKLSEYTGQSSTNILDELTTLAAKFNADQV